MSLSEPKSTSTIDPSGSASASQSASNSLWSRLTKRPVWLIALAVVLVVVGLGIAMIVRQKQAAGPTAQTTPTIRFLSGELAGSDNVDVRKIVQDFTKDTGIKVEEVFVPESIDTFDGIGEHILKNITSASPTIDVFIVDGTWMGQFADALLDLKPTMGDQLGQHFPQLVEAATVKGKILASPYFHDTMLLYYRTDLLKKYGYSAPPATWDELQTMATKIQAGEIKTNPDFSGFVWPADESGSLTTSALNLQSAYGGGTIIDNGKVTLNNPATAKALDQAKHWIGTISPLNVLKSTEEDVLTTWSAGNAAFMSNWTYAHGISQNESPVIKDKFDIAPLPAGIKRANSLGAEYIGAAKTTKYPKEAAKFVDYLTSKGVQKRSAINGTSIPTIPALYTDADVLAAQPYYPKLKAPLFEYGVSRPASNPHYHEVNQAYFSGIHKILTGQVDTKQGLIELEKELMSITGLPAGTP